jgi:2-C-methyl-D-erythritol 2,4-cyclodiphosphate synthase
LNQDGVAVAYATVLLESIAGPEQLGRMTATAEDEMDAVVESLVGNRRDTSALGRKVTPFDTDDLT